MIVGPEASTLLVRKPTTRHDSPHTHLIKHQTDSDNKSPVLQRRHLERSKDKLRGYVLKSNKTWEDDRASN
jgi:hypothetical protein